MLSMDRIRSKVVVAASWAACAFAGVAAWAYAGGSRWAGHPAVRAVVSGCAVLTLVFPLIICVVWLVAPWRGVTKRMASLFLRREALAVLALCHVLIQLSYFAGGTDLNDLLLPLTVVFGALLFAWLAAGRRSVNLATILPPILWLAALVCARIGLERAMAAIDPSAASWRGIALYASFAAALIVLALAPLAMLSNRLSVRALNTLVRWARPARALLCLALSVAVVLLFVAQVTTPISVRLDLALRGTTLAVLLLLAWTSLASSEGTPARAGAPPRWAPLDMSVKLFCVGAAGLGAAYLVLSRYVIAPTQINPDGLAYLTIAREISKGNLVVRGFWSPLLSWLLAPAIALGADPYAAFQFFIRFCGLAWIILGVALSRRAGLSRACQLALGIVLALIALARTFFPVTPDLLAAVVLAAYFLVLIRPTFSARPLAHGALAGLLGAAAAYAKYYSFPFFIAHILVWSVVLWHRRGRDARVLKTLATALLTFFLLTAPYTIAVSRRYGSLTFTTNPKINRAIYSPGGQPQFRCWASQLCPEPEDTLFPWEDPLEQYFPDLGWSPLQSLDNLRFQIRMAWSNLINTLSVTLVEVGPLPSVALAALALVTAVISGGEALPLWALSTVIIYISGYILITTLSFRYFLAILPLLWIAYFKVASSRSAAGLLPSTPWAAAAVQLAFLVIPILSFSWYGSLRSSFDYDNMACFRQDSLALADVLEAPFAGTDAMANHVAYYTDIRTVGVLPSEITPSEAAATLRADHVRTLLAASDLQLTTDLAALPGYEVLAETAICRWGYTVLRLPD
jgi:hypothetical protein